MRAHKNYTEPGTHFLDEQGREVLDDTPVAAPLGFEPTPNLMNQMRAMIRAELEAQGRSEEHETFEEADDFDTGDDDFDPTSPYEEQFWSMGVKPPENPGAMSALKADAKPPEDEVTSPPVGDKNPA